MKNKKSNSEQEQVTDIKGTIVGFVKPEPKEKTQEQEIQEFQLKKQNEKELALLSEEEQKIKREEYKKEQEKLEKVKAELIISIKERIPAIEKTFATPITNKDKIVQKVKSKTPQKIKEKEENLTKNQNKEEKERE